MQADLLRALQSGEIQRLGGERVIHVDVRIIAATNRDLKQAIREGRFREDLFFRLNVLSIEMPRLADRREDTILAAHFIKKHANARPHDPPVVGISPEVHRVLASFSWPGNVRELENAIEHAIAMGESSYIRPQELPEDLRMNKPGAGGTVLYSER
jgi:transcriptional regulator with PAS, ATPase and Fis domain